MNVFTSFFLLVSAVAFINIVAYACLAFFGKDEPVAKREPTLMDQLNGRNTGPNSIFAGHTSAIAAPIQDVHAKIPSLPCALRDV